MEAAVRFKIIDSYPQYWKLSLSGARGSVFRRVRKIAKIFFMSVCLSAWNNSAPTARILIKFDI
jgi:hypothetical protein